MKTHEPVFFNFRISMEVGAQPQFHYQEKSSRCPTSVPQSRCGGRGTKKTTKLLNNNNNNNNNMVPK